MSKIKTAKPLFKYIGGKTWLKDKLCEKVLYVLDNKQIDTYVEPFVGGMGAFLSVEQILFERGVGKIYLNDINREVIGIYETIKKNPFSLVEEVNTLEWQWMKTIPLKDDKTLHTKEELKHAQEFYKKTRDKFNENRGSKLNAQLARLVFLQKHSFNGIYRENARGEYNTPFNWSGKRTDDDFYDRVMQINKILNKFEVVFSDVSYEKIDYGMKNSLYYLDPPYINEKDGENKYNKDQFGLVEQINLIDKIKNSTFIYSNHKNDLLLEKINKLNNVMVETVGRRNLISSSGSSRNQKRKEILVVGGV